MSRKFTISIKQFTFLMKYYIKYYFLIYNDIENLANYKIIKLGYMKIELDGVL